MSLWWTVQLVSCDPNAFDLRETRCEVHAPSADLAAEECVRTWLEEEGATPASCATFVVEVEREGQPTVTRTVEAQHQWRTWSKS